MQTKRSLVRCLQKAGLLELLVRVTAEGTDGAPGCCGTGLGAAEAAEAAEAVGAAAADGAADRAADAVAAAGTERADGAADGADGADGAVAAAEADEEESEDPAKGKATAAEEALWASLRRRQRGEESGQELCREAQRLFIQLLCLWAIDPPGTPSLCPAASACLSLGRAARCACLPSRLCGAPPRWQRTR